MIPAPVAVVRSIRNAAEDKTLRFTNGITFSTMTLKSPFEEE